MRPDSDLWRFLRGWPARFAARCERNAPHSPPSSLWDASASRSTCPPRFLWLRWPLAGFAAFGLCYALANGIAESAYSAAWAADAAGRGATRASIVAQVFPFDPRLRAAPAQYYSARRWPGSRDYAIGVLQNYLDGDPFAVDMRRNLAGYLLEAGDKAGAARELGIVQTLSPRSQINLRVNVNPETGGVPR